MKKHKLDNIAHNVLFVYIYLLTVYNVFLYIFCTVEERIKSHFTTCYTCITMYVKNPELNLE